MPPPTMTMRRRRAGAWFKTTNHHPRFLSSFAPHVLLCAFARKSISRKGARSKTKGAKDTRSSFLSRMLSSLLGVHALGGAFRSCSLNRGGRPTPISNNRRTDIFLCAARAESGRTGPFRHAFNDQVAIISMTGMRADGGRANQVESDLLRDLLRFCVEVVQHFHVIEMKPTGATTASVTARVVSTRAGGRRCPAQATAAKGEPLRLCQTSCQRRCACPAPSATRRQVSKLRLIVAVGRHRKRNAVRVNATCASRRRSSGICASAACKFSMFGATKPGWLRRRATYQPAVRLRRLSHAPARCLRDIAGSRNRNCQRSDEGERAASCRRVSSARACRGAAGASCGCPSTRKVEVAFAQLTFKRGDESAGLPLIGLTPPNNS